MLAAWRGPDSEPRKKSLSTPDAKSSIFYRTLGRRQCESPEQGRRPDGANLIAKALPAAKVPPLFPIAMSQHRSLKGASTITAKRNVLKRFERVEVLRKRGQFKDGDKVIGLRKTKPDA